MAGVAPSILLILLKLLAANTALLLALKLVVEQEEGFFVGLRSANDSEHPFTGFVMGLLGNRNL